MATAAKPPGFTTALVIGGARSGKSAFAERAARETGLARCYLATAEAWDAEMAERIARHQADRGPDWRTVETPHALPAALRAEAAPDRVVLIDCLTLWLSNRMLAEADLDADRAALLEAIDAARGPVILVSNEVGLGVVPDTPLGRRFRDAQGRLNQAVAAIADQVTLIAAGLPLALKGPGIGAS